MQEKGVRLGTWVKRGEERGKQMCNSGKVGGVGESFGNDSDRLHGNN